MPDRHEVELFISEDGELKVHIKGIKGPGCVKTLESLALQLGEEKDRELTSEYYEKEKGKNIDRTKT
jgi:hypothetical protein